jgi:hypothetical protein
MSERENLLSEFASIMLRAAYDGKLDGKRLMIDENVVGINGPRSGALEMLAGFDSGRLINALAANDCALARQLIPWNFKLDPSVYMSGRFVRVEAGWPDRLAETDVRVSALRTALVMDHIMRKSGRWLAGKCEDGRVAVPLLGGDAPHLAVSGVTRSGKTVTLRSMIAQLSERHTPMVLIDGKNGDGLRGLDRLPGVIGPLASDVETARGALSWALLEMSKRYENPERDRSLLLVAIDEVQELNKDKAFSQMVERIATQGGAAGLSLVLATQHPSVDNFGGPVTKRQIGQHIALRVTDADASRVAMGRSEPRADRLLGCGDAWIERGGEECQRVQIAMYDERKIVGMLTDGRMFEEWPEVATEEALPDKWPGAAELGAAIVLVQRDASTGKDRYLRALRDEFDLPGMSNDRAVKLLKYARQVNDTISSVRPVENAHPDVIMLPGKTRRTVGPRKRTDGRTGGTA